VLGEYRLELLRNKPETVTQSSIATSKLCKKKIETYQCSAMGLLYSVSLKVDVRTCSNIELTSVFTFLGGHMRLNHSHGFPCGCSLCRQISAKCRFPA
jgi:hypothetical protein